MSSDFDAIVIGSGPNGLAAAIELARAKRSVCVFEFRQTIGGGARSEELTLPGFVHDICSAIHPLAIVSPFFKTLPLQDHGLEWIQPPSPLAHPFQDGTAVLLRRSIDETETALGADGAAYRRLMSLLVSKWNDLALDILSPLHVPRHPIRMARFAARALRSSRDVALSHFESTQARGLFAGLGAHSALSLDQPLSAGVAMILGALVHVGGWPFPKGGAQKISDALASYFRSLGGKVVTGVRIDSLEQLPKCRAVLCDVTPAQLLKIAGGQLPQSYRRALERYRYGFGVFKVDWALSQPIPWKHPNCLDAGTVHLGGTLPEIAESERIVAHGGSARQPFVLLAQHSLFDCTRAPANAHTAWAYCHVPNGSTVDMTECIEDQVERFAPGFRECILKRHTMSTSQFEAYNPNYIGGDIGGGTFDFRQWLTRPVFRLNPYCTPNRKLYICSSSTPPGGGVHGMCGYHAARAALASVLA